MGAYGRGRERVGAGLIENHKIHIMELQYNKNKKNCRLIQDFSYHGRAFANSAIIASCL